MVAGTPVITTDMTAAAGELVLHDRNGYVLPLDVESWSAAISRLLLERETWQSFSEAAETNVAQYTFDHAARGILAAMNSLRAGEVPFSANQAHAP